MSTPFELLRRHQKVLLVAVTGTAVLSFIVSDATSNSGQISPIGVAALVIGSLAVVGWVWGAGQGKSAENAIFGGVLGLAITLIFTFMGRPPAEVSTVSGNISNDDLIALKHHRNLANRMVDLVYYNGNPNAGFLAQFQLPEYRFGFRSQTETHDVLISELLNREADDLGLEVTDQAAMNFLKEVAGKDTDGKEQLTQEVFAKAVENTAASFPGTNEDTIIEALRHEMRAKQAAQILVGGNRMTPADVWELHRKLNTRQTAQFVGIPMADFIDKAAKPSEANLQQIFEEYKANFPNTRADNSLDEGRPSLFLPRRVRLAYVEPVYEDIEKLAGEVTEEEIVARYELQYKKEMPASDPHGDLNFLDFQDFPEMPELPNVPKAPATTPDPAAPATDAPADSAPATEKLPDAAAPEAKPAEPATPPATEKPAGEQPAPDKPADPAAKPDGASLRPRVSQLQPVVLIQDQPAAEAAKPAEATPAAEAPAAAPATETPAAPAAEVKPAEEKPADPKPAGETPAEEPAAPAGEKPAAAPLTVPSLDGLDPEGDPAPPVAKIRPLTEELRQQIRDELLAEKTRPLMEERVYAARDFMNDLHLGVSEYLNHQKASTQKSGDRKKTELSKDAISSEEATQRVQEYAKTHGLLYAETPLLTLDELLISEDHPLGGAQTGKETRVFDTVNQSQTEFLYSATAAFDLDRKGSYAFWKIEDVKAHIPASLDEPGVREKATQIWRTMQARPLAEKRAQALADLVSKSDKPMAEALAEQTVTGEQDKSLFVTVKQPGEFSWLQRSSTPQQFGGGNAPRLGGIDGVEGAGDNFMAKLFNDMQPGDTAVVPNFDRTIYYVVHVDQRTPSTESEIAVMRKQFLESQGDLASYAQQQSRSRDGSFADRLFIKHGVKMSGSEDEIGE